MTEGHPSTPEPQDAPGNPEPRPASPESAPGRDGAAGEPGPTSGGGPGTEGEAELPQTILREMDQLRAQVAELEGLRRKAKERDEFLALAQRVQADFINYQKRLSAEKDQWSKFLHADLIRDLLPALDALELCVATARRGGDPAAHLEGFRIATQELMRILEKNGLQVIAPTEGPFDPATQEAVGFKESTGQPEQTVAELVRRGYRLHGRILRPSQVLLARQPAAGETEADANRPDGAQRVTADAKPRRGARRAVEGGCPMGGEMG
jgi:molecular chaperone GrpE